MDENKVETKGEDVDIEDVEEIYYFGIVDVVANIADEANDRHRKLEQFTDKRDILHAVEYDLCVTLKNVGDENFPGGTIENVKVQTPTTGMSRLIKSLRTDIDVPSIDPGKEEEIEFSVSDFTTPGTGIIRFEISVSPDEVVSIHNGDYDTGDFTLNKEGTISLPVLDREQVRSNSYLDSIQSLLEGDCNGK